MAMTTAQFTIVWLIMHISRARELASFRSCVDQIVSVAQVFLGLQPHLLLKHIQMLRRLHELQPDLAFKQSQLCETIAVLTKRHPHGRFNDQTLSKDIFTTIVNVTFKGPLGLLERIRLFLPITEATCSGCHVQLDP